MKKIRYLLLATALTLGFTLLPVSAAPDKPKVSASMPSFASSNFSFSVVDMTATTAASVDPLSASPIDFPYDDMSTDELWEQFSYAQAYKKLCEFQEKALHEQIKLLEKPYAVYNTSNSDYSAVYSQLSELKQQQYLLKTQKEQYEWQKRQAEEYLKLTGAKTGKAEVQYSLYIGTLPSSGLSYEELYAQRYTLQTQEQQLELQMKTLDCQYQMGQITEDEFLSHYASAVRQKEMVKMERERYEAEIENMASVNTPTPALPKIP